jgi:choline dehydrogenase-like flavoprotein
MVEGARSIGMPIFDSNNGRLMEDGGGASVMDVRVRDGKRLSVFRTYVFPYMDRPNLTVVTHALVTKLTLEGKRAIGVEITFDGKIQRITAGLEVVLSLGAMHTPKVLILSRIGDQAKLRRLGIPVVQRLPGMGQNGAPTKTHTLNMLHRLIDGKPIDPPAVKPPNALTLTTEPQVNVERYDSLRKVRRCAMRPNPAAGAVLIMAHEPSKCTAWLKRSASLACPRGVIQFQC